MSAFSTRAMWASVRAFVPGPMEATQSAGTWSSYSRM
jgi:hypothetical protein